MANTKNLSPAQDEVVVYHSIEDQCWIAHSLRTDQVGTGARIVDALADLIVAMDQVLAIAAEDATVAHEREAPPEIQRLARSATALPKEIFEIAYKVARGEWPADLPPNIEARDATGSFKAAVPRGHAA